MIFQKFQFYKSLQEIAFGNKPRKNFKSLEKCWRENFPEYELVIIEILLPSEVLLTSDIKDRSDVPSPIWEISTYEFENFGTQSRQSSSS